MSCCPDNTYLTKSSNFVEITLNSEERVNHRVIPPKMQMEIQTVKTLTVIGTMRRRQKRQVKAKARGIITVAFLKWPEAVCLSVNWKIMVM